MLIRGRFIKQEQWECWHAKQKLVSGSKHWRGGTCVPLYPSPTHDCTGLGSGGGRCVPLRKNFEILYEKSCNLVHLWSENGPFRSAIYHPFLGAQTNLHNAASFSSTRTKMRASIVNVTEQATDRLTMLHVTSVKGCGLKLCSAFL